MSRKPRTYKGKATKATEAFTNMSDIRDMFASARSRSVSGPSTFTSSDAGFHPTRPLFEAIGTVKPSQIQRRSVSVSDSVTIPAVSSSPPVKAPPANRRRLIEEDKEEDEQNTPDTDTLQLDNEVFFWTCPNTVQLTINLPHRMSQTLRLFRNYLQLSF
ncbi:hypothetical protein BC830DRAFT_567155 [Chytriomyces sp. MP71]|nr:hypothetical protein BC830DRAFT_567155 [Chytriomyces sp. MP71]